MARGIFKLTAKGVEALNKPGRHGDGGGLYLSIGPGETAARRWVFIFRDRGTGKLREMGLGSAPGRGRLDGRETVSLSAARELAATARRQLSEGVDPIEARRAAEGLRKAPKAEGISAATEAAERARKARTFGAVADEYIKTHEAGWRSPIHCRQWVQTLRDHAAELRDMDVAEIGVDDVLKALRPIWLKTPETASRVRGRVETVLDAAKARKLRTGENPAAWRGNLALLLPPRQKLSRGHHAAMPYADVPAFVARLRDAPSTSSLGLEFVILTAARSGEVRGARWDEIDFARKVWNVPAHRMKGGQEHRVALSDRALEVLKLARMLSGSELVFPGARSGQPLSVMAFDMLLRRLDVDVTTHGFRSSFRDWAGDATGFPRDVVEGCLAHRVGNDVELAYRRSDALEKRRRVMDAWAGFLAKPAAGKVVALRAGGAR